MTTAQALAPHLRARRAKIFAGFEKPRQLDRNLRARLMTRGRALMRKTKKRQALRRHHRQGLRRPRRPLVPIRQLDHRLLLSVLRNHRRSRGLLALPRRRRHQAPGGRWPSHLGQPAEMGQRALRRSLRARRPAKTRAAHLEQLPIFRSRGDRDPTIFIQVQNSDANPKPRFSS